MAVIVSAPPLCSIPVPLVVAPPETAWPRRWPAQQLLLDRQHDLLEALLLAIQSWFDQHRSGADASAYGRATALCQG